MAGWSDNERAEAESIMDDFEALEVAARYSRPLPIERLTAPVAGPGEGECQGCGTLHDGDPCPGCVNEYWTPACGTCGGPVESPLARLGSVRCQDCRDEVGQVSDFLRRAA